MESQNKNAAIIGGSSLLVAALGIFGALNYQSEVSNIEGNNNTVIQDTKGDVIIDQSVNNDLSKIREYEANSMKESLISGCSTMREYFENGEFFDVDSVDTLVGSVRSQKTKFVSFFGSDAERTASDILKRFNKHYLDYIPGLYAMHIGTENMVDTSAAESLGVDTAAVHRSAD
ncbi:MAG: hypothetical protein AAF993_12785 [Pseudomonadota bacterium]